MFGGFLMVLFFVNGTSFLRFLSVFYLGKCMAAYNCLGTLRIFTMVIKANNLWKGNEQSSMPFSEQMDLCVLPTACILSKNLINKDRPYLSDKTNTSIQKMLYISQLKTE